MTRIETLKAQVAELQETYENDMILLKEIISERAEMVFSMIDLTKSIYTDDVVCRMIYNQVTETGLIKRIESAYHQIERIKTIITALEVKYRRPVTFDSDYYNYTTDKDAKTIEDCIIKLYYTKSKISVYSLGITRYTQNLIYREKKEKTLDKLKKICYNIITEKRGAKLNKTQKRIYCYERIYRKVS